MTQKQKELLMKDLCARLPYGVIVEIEDEPQTPVQFEWQHLNFIINWKWTIKPYLRPMSSMTEEEYKEFYKVVFESQNIDGISASTYVSDWLISKQFDVRGLIERGLALEAPEDMYTF